MKTNAILLLIMLNLSLMLSAGTDHTLCINSTLTLTPTGTPAVSNAWQSLDISKATVDVNSGLVTALDTGMVSVVFTDITNVTDTFHIFVFDPLRFPGITGNPQHCEGYTQSLYHEIPGGAWVSSDPAIASIDNSGLVSSHTPGNTVITYTVTEGSCIATSTINLSVVHYNPVNITLSSGASSVSQIVSFSHFSANNDTLFYNPMIPITYQVTGDYSSVFLVIPPSILAPGVSFNFDANSGVATISGTPFLLTTPSDTTYYPYKIGVLGKYDCSDADPDTLFVNGYVALGLPPPPCNFNITSSASYVPCTNWDGYITFTVTGGTFSTFTSNVSGNNSSWSVSGSGNTILAGGPVPATGVTVTITVSGLCPSSTSSATIYPFNNSGHLHNNNPDITICAGDSIPEIRIDYSYYADVTGLPASLSSNIGGGLGFIRGNIDTPGVYNYTVTVQDYCFNYAPYSETYTINVLTQPSVQLGATTDLCAGEQFQVTGAIVEGDTYNWSHNGHGSLMDTNTLSPKYISSFNDVGGTVILTLIANSNSGCPSDTSSMFLVVNPSVSPIQLPTYICDQRQFQASNNYPGGTWYSTDPSIASVDNTGLISAHSGGVVTIGYFVSGNSTCNDSSTANIEIKPLTMPQFTLESTYCQGTQPPSLPLVSSDSPGILGTWSGQIQTTNPGNFELIFEPVIAGCADTFHYVFDVLPLPVADFSYQYSGDTLYLTDLSLHANSGILWTVQDTLFSTLPSWEFVYTSTDSLHIQLLASNSCGTDEKHLVLLLNPAAIHELTNGFQLFPNPVTDQIRLISPYKNGELELVDLTGRKTYSAFIHSIQQDFNISNLKPGEYIAIFQYENTNLILGRIIKL